LGGRARHYIVTPKHCDSPLRSLFRLPSGIVTEALRWTNEFSNSHFLFATFWTALTHTVLSKKCANESYKYLVRCCFLRIARPKGEAPSWPTLLLPKHRRTSEAQRAAPSRSLRFRGACALEGFAWRAGEAEPLCDWSTWRRLAARPGRARSVQKVANGSCAANGSQRRTQRAVPSGNLRFTGACALEGFARRAGDAEPLCDWSTWRRLPARPGRARSVQKVANGSCAANGSQRRTQRAAPSGNLRFRGACALEGFARRAVDAEPRCDWSTGRGLAARPGRARSVQKVANGPCAANGSQGRTQRAAPSRNMRFLRALLRCP